MPLLASLFRRQDCTKKIVRTFPGYDTPLVEWFLLQYAALYIRLLHHLQTYPEKISLYIESGTYVFIPIWLWRWYIYTPGHIQTQSPFIYRALVQCLTTLQPDATLEQSSGPGFKFFRRKYIHTSQMDWKSPFETKIRSLGYSLGSSSPECLAHTLISTDEVDFTGLSQQNIIANDAVVKGLSAS
ncbi:hypothetical protein N7523_005736 [Penicillium sp. IBT 18751x]|nr:hypothetical protein N7523_005671 [Penicillium sp. IBT 18751x]KAJ6117985.1 hypothetical protein N7523_005736 [Penicillium sp. IBT 18751x]